jgi:hypothetical protein
MEACSSGTLASTYMMCHSSDNLNLHTSGVLTGPRNYSLKHLNDFHLLLSKGKEVAAKTFYRNLRKYEFHAF